MIKRYATPIALGVAVGVYLAFFFLLAGDDGLLLRLAAPAGLAAVAAAGVWFMLSRTAAEVQQDNYAEMSREKVRRISELLAEAARTSGRVRDARVRDGVELARHQVPELLARIEQSDPTGLFSSASKFEGHVESLVGLVKKYADIEARPRYYDDPESMLADGIAAVDRFNEFTVESIRLVNQGAMSEYKANLQLVAPPEIPQIKGLTA